MDVKLHATAFEFIVKTNPPNKKDLDTRLENQFFHHLVKQNLATVSLMDNINRCDGCEEWFHLNCVRLKAPPPDTDPWHCSAKLIDLAVVTVVLFCFSIQLSLAGNYNYCVALPNVTVILLSIYCTASDQISCLRYYFLGNINYTLDTNIS